MTMPNERTRAFIQTRDLLVELAEDPALSASIRRQARQLLRHYPNSKQMLLAGLLEERRGDRLTEPFLSSSVDWPHRLLIIGQKPLILSH
ncbi:hypothetical protein D3C76_1053240 [compost metagenome]